MPNVSRRGFFHALAVLAGTAALDPEQLLWTPKAMVTAPAMPYGVSFANDPDVGVQIDRRGLQQFLMPGWVAQEALNHLQNNLLLTAAFTSPYPLSFEGSALTVPLRVRSRVTL